MGFFTPKWKKARVSADDATAAVCRIKDQKTLKEAAMSASWRQARIAAISRITDESFLFALAQREEEHFDLRKAAVSHIRSQDLLIRLSCLQTESALPSAAIEGVTEKRLLVQALHSPAAYVRRYALDKLNDQDLFKKHAAHDTDDDIRRFAFNRISDLHDKKDLALSESSDKMLESMLLLFKPNQFADDQAFWRALYDKASNSADAFPHSFPIIVSRLRDDMLLRSIALNGKTHAIRCAAARAIQNENIIAELIMQAKLDMSVKQDLYFCMKNRALVDKNMRREIEYRDYRFWSDQDKKLADSLSADSY